MSIANYRALLQLSFLVVCAGCERTGEADTPEAGGGHAPPLTQAEFVSRFQALACQNLQRCCSASGLALDESICPAIFANAGMGTVGTTYAPASGTQCIAELEAATQCWMRPGGNACSRVYSGARAPGETCTAASDCASTPGGTAACDEVRGICTLAVHGNLGDACQRSCELDNYGGAWCAWGAGSNPTASGSTVDCFANDGLACGNVGRCVALAGLGQPCENDDSCDRSLYCRVPAGGATATCQSRGTIGSPCDQFNAPCVNSAYCSAGGCVAKKANGQACLTNAECSGVCLCGVGGCATTGVCTDPNAIQSNVDVFNVVTSYCHG